jgi:hypothetical protein
MELINDLNRKVGYSHKTRDTGKTGISCSEKYQIRMNITNFIDK